MKKIVLSVTSLAMLAGLSFGAPLHWPKLHHKAKQEQTTKTTKTTKGKKSHHWFHHKKSKKSSGTSAGASL